MFWLVVLIALVAITILLSLPTLFHGAVYMPTKPERIEQMLDLARLTPGQRIADFGSGDGRIVIAFAQAGVDAHGYEVDPILVLWSRWKIHRAGLSDRATIHWKSFWSANASDFDLITVYGFPTFMARLEQKLRAELRPNSRVISLVYSFPTWQPTVRRDKLHLYEHR